MPPAGLQASPCDTPPAARVRLIFSSLAAAVVSNLRHSDARPLARSAAPFPRDRVASASWQRWSRWEVPSRELTDPPFSRMHSTWPRRTRCQVGTMMLGDFLQKLTLEAAVVAVCDSGRKVVVRKV